MGAKMAQHSALAYFVAFSIVGLVMWLPSRTTRASTDGAWYRCIRPSITPPNYVFPVVWTILYALIAVSLANAILLPSSTWKRWLLIGFGANLALNVLWSYLYFGKKNLAAAMAVIVILWTTILYIVVGSFRLHVQKWKALLLLPYLFWVTFAAVLNGISWTKQKECSALY